MLFQSIREALVTQRQSSNSSGDDGEVEVARLQCPQYFGEVDSKIASLWSKHYILKWISHVSISLPPRWRCCWTSPGPPPSPPPGSWSASSWTGPGEVVFTLHCCYNCVPRGRFERLLGPCSAILTRNMGQYTSTSTATAEVADTHWSICHRLTLLWTRSTKVGSENVTCCCITWSRRALQIIYYYRLSFIQTIIISLKCQTKSNM